MSLVLTDFLTNHIKCSLILEPCFPNSPWPERRLKSRAISSEPDLAFEDDKGSELEAESEVVSELAAGDPKNSDTSNGGAPEQTPIKMAKKIVDFPNFVRLVMMAAKIWMNYMNRWADLTQLRNFARVFKILTNFCWVLLRLKAGRVRKYWESISAVGNDWL